MLATHLRRAVALKVDEVKPKSHEVDSLDESITRGEGPFLTYLVWRKSTALVAVVPFLVSACLEYVAMAEGLDRIRRNEIDTQGARASVIFPRLDSSILFALSVYCSVAWNEFTSRHIVAFRVLWMIAFIMPLFPPLFFGKAVNWPDYSLEVIPLALSLPYSINRASIRTCLLVPESHVALGILFLSLPVYSLVVLLSILPVHDADDGPASLTAGMFLLATSPWIYVATKKAYLRPEGKEENRRWTEIIFGLFNFTGILCLLAWGYRGRIRLPRDIIQFLLEGIGRSLITNVLAADGLILLSATSWLSDKERGSETMERADAVFSPICKAMYSRDPEKSARPTTDADTTEDDVEIGMHDIFREPVMDLKSDPSTPKKSEPKPKEKRKEPKEAKAEIGMHDVFRDSVTDVILSESEKSKTKETVDSGLRDKEIKHEIFDTDVDDGKDADPEDLMKMMRDMADRLDELDA